MDVWATASSGDGHGREYPHPNLLLLLDVFEISSRQLVTVSELMRCDLMSQILRANRREHVNGGGNGGGHGNGNGASDKSPKSNGSGLVPLLPLAWVRRIVLDVSRGLAHLHKSGIIHRNVS